MTLHDVYSLATHLPGSWLLNKSRLDSAIEHVAYEKAKRAAGNALYNMIQEGLKNDPDYKEDLYKTNVQRILQQLEDDPEINKAILKAKEVEKRFAEHPYDDSTLAEPGADVYWYDDNDTVRIKDSPLKNIIKGIKATDFKQED